jgi:hypothetical protein
MQKWRWLKMVKLNIAGISLTGLLVCTQAWSQTQTMKDYVYMGQQVVALETQQVTCTYQISPTSVSIGSGSNSGSVTVTAPAGCGWTAVSNNTSWLTVTSGANGSGNGTVGYAVSQNSGSARNGTITIGGQTFTVSQASGCTYSVSPTSASYGASGGSATFSVTTTTGCTWTATNNGNSWVTITSGSSGNGSGTVGYTVANNTGPSRSGYLAIAGQQPYVSQSSYTQPTSMSFSPATGFAGIDSYTVTVGNGAYMTVGVKYNYTPWGAAYTYINLTGTIGPMDGSGQQLRALYQSDSPGTYVFTAIRNIQRDDWVSISSVTFILRPAKPTGFTFTPSTLQLPGTHYVTTANGQNQTILEEEQDPPNNTTAQWPITMDSSGSWSANVPCGTTPGLYTITRVRNDLDSGSDAWLTLSGVTQTLVACP